MDAINYYDLTSGFVVVVVINILALIANTGVVSCRVELKLYESKNSLVVIVLYLCVLLCSHFIYRRNHHLESRTTPCLDEFCSLIPLYFAILY